MSSSSSSSPSTKRTAETFEQPDPKAVKSDDPQPEQQQDTKTDLEPQAVKPQAELATIGTVPYIVSINHRFPSLRSTIKIDPETVPKTLFTVIQHSTNSFCLSLHANDPRLERKEEEYTEKFLEQEQFPLSCWVNVAYTAPIGHEGVPLITKCEGRFGPGATIYKSADCKDHVFIPTEQELADIKRAACGTTSIENELFARMTCPPLPVKRTKGQSRKADAEAEWRAMEARMDKIEAKYDAMIAEVEALQSKYPIKPVIWRYGALSATALLVNGQPCVRVRCGSDRLTVDVPLPPPKESSDENEDEEQVEVFLVNTAVVAGH
jgi:hypothetical protein